MTPTNHTSYACFVKLVQHNIGYGIMSLLSILLQQIFTHDNIQITKPGLTSSVNHKTDKLRVRKYIRSLPSNSIGKEGPLGLHFRALVIQPYGDPCFGMKWDSPFLQELKRNSIAMLAKSILSQEYKYPYTEQHGSEHTVEHSEVLSSVALYLVTSPA